MIGTGIKKKGDVIMIASYSAPRTAIILGGGVGKRFLPLSRHIPKPLVPICNKPPIIQTMEQSQRAGVEKFYVRVSHMPGEVIAGLGDEIHNSTIEYAVHNQDAMGTAGGVKRTFEQFSLPKDAPFWVFSGDIFAPEVNLSDIAASHAKAVSDNERVIGTIGFKLVPAKDCIGRFGVGIVDEEGIVTSFEEKPKTMAEALRLIKMQEGKNPSIAEKSAAAGCPMLAANASYYLFNGNIFDEVSQDRTEWDFGGHVFPRLTGRINASLFEAPWFDVGTPRDFWLAQWYFLNVASSMNQIEYISDWGLRGRGTSIEGVTGDGNSVIGNDVSLKNVVLDHAIIGHGCQIRDARISWSVVLPNTFINTRDIGSAKKVSNISGSIVGGKNAGTFIDRDSFDQDSIEKKILVPHSGVSHIQNLSAEDLAITDADIEVAKKSTII